MKLKVTKERKIKTPSILLPKPRCARRKGVTGRGFASRAVSAPEPAAAEPAEPAEAVETNDTGRQARTPADETEREPRESYTGETAFQLYLQEIGQTKLLTPQEEIALAGLVRSGDKKARELMIKANLRLVVKIARDYEGLGLPLLDLISEGNIGLMKAVEKFDPSKGAKLSTYGAWWIKQSIKRALANQTKTIRLPVHVVDKLFHMRKAEMKLRDVLGRDPSNEELGEELGITASRIAQYRTASMAPSSLDAPLGDEDSNMIKDVVADQNASTPYRNLEEKTNSSLVRDMVATLDEREAEILRYRFGLDGDSERTLEEVGVKFGVTRERIRQIQNVALHKLRKKIESLETVQVAA